MHCTKYKVKNVSRETFFYLYKPNIVLFKMFCRIKTYVKSM